MVEDESVVAQEFKEESADVAIGNFYRLVAF
jgi:hypothetical protein